MVFLIVGAWPVFGFFGLDVLLIYWAFRVNYRAAAAYEEISVTPLASCASARSAIAARCAEWMLNPLWVQLDRAATRNSG